jgi:hypothetical protein
VLRDSGEGRRYPFQVVSSISTLLGKVSSVHFPVVEKDVLELWTIFPESCRPITFIFHFVEMEDLSLGTFGGIMLRDLDRTKLEHFVDFHDCESIGRATRNTCGVGGDWGHVVSFVVDELVSSRHWASVIKRKNWNRISQAVGKAGLVVGNVRF